MNRLNLRVLTTVMACVVFGLTARPAVAQSKVNAFVHASFGVKIPAEKNYIQDFASDDVQETDTYQTKSKMIVSVGGGVTFAPMWGAMVSFSRYSDPEPAHTRYAIPSIGFDASATTPGNFLHTETDVHLDVCFIPRMSGMVDLMVFGGLSHFGVAQDLIGDFDPDFFGNKIFADTIEKSVGSPEKGSAWGFNAGLSITKPMNKNIGIGGMVRYAHGHVKLKDALEEFFNDDDSKTVSMKVGGFEASGGVIIRIK